MSPKTKLAFLGGLAGVIGTPLIIFTQNLLMNVFALIVGMPPFPFPWDRWLSNPWGSIVRWDGFVAGFLAVFLVAPFAIQRIDSASRSDRRFPKTGTLYGALAGFVCCVLLAFIRLGTDFVGPTLYRDGFSALPGVLGYYTTYLRITAIATGPFAAIIGACVGAILELRRRKTLPKIAATAEKAS
jgi:hypothetical protein